MRSDPNVVPFQSRTFACLRCGLPAQQVWSALRSDSPGVQGYPDFVDEPITSEALLDGTGLSSWAASRCQACGYSTIWRDDIAVYPVAKAGPAAHERMPPLVAELYDEARAVLPVSRRAGAALARAAMERLLRDVDTDAPAGARLDDRINRIHSRVSVALGESLDVIRYLGNQALHVDAEQHELVYVYLDETDPAIAEFMFSSINQLVDELIARPEQAKERFDQLPDSVRESIARKRAKDDASQNIE